MLAAEGDTAADWQRSTELVWRYYVAFAAVLVAWVGALIAGALMAWRLKNRELALAFFYGAIFCVLSAVSASTAYSQWDWVYLPGVALLGVLVGGLLRWRPLQGFFVGMFLATLISPWSVKLLMRLL